MYLKTIELLGFKSFAQKTVLEFHRGVTAVVGPNGCGKSNVLDAIRWVLGEQSAKALRGGEMADVIFSGTDSRQALGMAEVSLTFAECQRELGTEYDEVCITRRVFRDGSSAYFLNKTPCRLKDIHQMFMDTGIGRSAYSIMEQGKIDQILSSKPEERRAVFEEAAGITRFKSQKKEALRKLEATEANLLRVTDVIKEVKRQIGSLQRQAGKARRYQALTGDLRILETHFGKHQFDDLRQALERVREEIERLSGQHAAQQADMETRESALGDQRHAVSEKSRALSEARQSVQEGRNRVVAAESRIAFNNERIREAELLVDRYGLDVAAAEEKLLVQQTEIEHADLEIEQIRATLDFEQERLSEKDEANTAARNRRIDQERAAQELFRAITSAENEGRTLEGALAGAHQMHDQTAERIRVLTDEITAANQSLERLERQHLEIERQIQDLGDQSRASADLAEREGEEANETRRELQRVTEHLSEVRRKLAERESKLEVLKALNDAGDGFAEGTKAVLKGLDNPEFFKPSIGGSLASALEVPPEYVRAIEAALGAALEAVIVKDASVAESIIQTLVHHRMGRASLAVRDFAAPGPFADSPELPEGSVGWACEKVGAPDSLKPLVSHLLRGVVLVDSLGRMMELRARGAGAGLTLVSLDGEVLTADGILRGGLAGVASSSVLDRKHEIAALEAAAADCRVELEGAVGRQQVLQENLEAVQARLAAADAESRRIEVALSSLRGQMGLSQREMDGAKRQLERFVREQEEAALRHEKSEAERIRIQEAIVLSAQKVEELHARRNEAESALEAARGEESTIAAELSELRIKVATERQRLSSLANQRQPMNNRLQELRDLIAQRQREIGEYRHRTVTLAEACETIREEIADLGTRIEEGETRVSLLDGERRALEEGLEREENDLRILRRQLAESSERRGQQEVRATQIQLRMDNVREHVQRRHQVDLETFASDSYALACALRDQEKRLRKLSASPEEGAGEEVESSAQCASAEDAAEAEAAAAQEEVQGESEARFDWTRVEQYVNEISRRLDSMGPVNLDAIQEYEELEERYTFLEKQVTDLDHAKTELLDVIAKINATTRTMFAETFEKVRTNFQEMFTELFGGGKANLVLVDESDPLESGIDIIARPPGKQLQSITLLSGGEKTMTAVALLFSIYMVKPSPFCVLDEMDAPLDESNISRFIRILDRFISQSQFVVITHNKRTIARADVIYGVTMEEHGISKLVGVRFTQRDDSSASSDIIGTKNPHPHSPPSVAESFGKTGELLSDRMEEAG